MQNRSGRTTKHRLVWSLETQINESETSAYEVGEQRERNYRYYTLQALGNEQRGRSHYISPDVLDAVEGKKAVFSEIYLQARDKVRFSKSAVPGEAEQKTAYVNRCFKKNNIARVLRDGWHDAFVAKRLVTLVEWVPEEDQQFVNLQGALLPMVEQQLRQMPGILGVDDSQIHYQTMPTVQGPQQVMSGRLMIEMEGGYVGITLMQPERYFRDPDATYPDMAEWNAYEEDISRGKLIEMGFDREQIESLAVDYRFRSEEEDAARKRHDSSWTRRRQHNRMSEQETVSYYRTWTWLDVDEETFADLDLGFEPEMGYDLYEIHWSHGEVLKYQDGNHAVRKVQDLGIFEWCEMPISHAETGMCTADVLAHTQKNQSGLKRLVYDNQQMANAGRNVMLSGALKNPRDLLDNKIGATLIAKRPDAVTPLAPPMLSPLTMEAIAMFKQDGEERSGLSGLAKGMNTDAVKYQNADNMIERLTTAGQRRVTAQARDFANTWFVPVAQHIIRLAMEHDTSSQQIEIAGQMIQFSPQQWQDDLLEMEVDVALTPEESQSMAQQMLMLHTMLVQDPTMAMAYGAEQKHAVIDRIYELMGIADTSRYILAPSDPRYQQAMQQQGQQMAMEQQKQDQMMGLQVQNMLSQDRREWARLEWDRQDDHTDNVLNERKQNWLEDKEQQELEIERRQQRNVAIG